MDSCHEAAGKRYTWAIDVQAGTSILCVAHTDECALPDAVYKACGLLRSNKANGLFQTLPTRLYLLGITVNLSSYGVQQPYLLCRASQLRLMSLHIQQTCHACGSARNSKHSHTQQQALMHAAASTHAHCSKH